MTQIFVLFLLVLPCVLSEVWIIHVYTANEQFSGTDANVFIRLFNSKDESTGEYQLTHSNLLKTSNELHFQNLFEMGAVDRFRIRTEKIGSVAKIDIRHDNFPILHADWLLEQVVVENEHDHTKYIFKCNCWLRRGRPFATISASSEQNTPQKPNEKSSSTARTLVIILVILITFMISMFCCYNEYYRRKHQSSLYPIHPSEHHHQEPSLINSQFIQIPSVPIESRTWFKRLRLWRNFVQRPPAYNYTQRVQQNTHPAGMTSIVLSDEPPSYEELYPTTPSSVTIMPNSNVRYI